MVSASLHVQAEVDARGFAVDIEVGSGDVLAVLGPNGAGKSTLLGVVSGLVRPDRGRVVLDGRVLTDVAAGVAIAPHGRSVALLAQQPLLFPHLTVAANVEFAPRAAGRGRRAARNVAHSWLEAVGALDLAQRRPHELSGGQAQRVAIARALAAEPTVLLLDEPLAALDVSAAPAIRSLLREVLRSGDRTAVVITHDVLDALAFADRAVVIESGRVAEAGTVGQVLTRPRSDFAARIAGLNLWSGRAQRGGRPGLVTEDGMVVYGIVDEQCSSDEGAVAVCAPHAVAVYVDAPEGSPRNVFDVVVDGFEARGSVVTVRARMGASMLSAEITAAAAAELDLVPGARAYFVVKATEVAVHARA